MSKIKKRLIIIDGNALIHRSFHALPPTMKLKSGEMVNAVFGFATVLIKSIREFNPEYVVVAFDKKGKTFRHEKFPEYKAHREKAPDDLYMQIPLIKRLVKAFNIPIFEESGFEADDLIGTIAKTVDGDVEKIIVTGDMDILQLINKHTKVYKMGRGLSEANIFDEKLTKQKYNITPGQIIDYKALRGDPSDDIPGVPGVGDKTATQLLHDFKSLDGVYKNIKNKKTEDKIKSRILGLLEKHKEDAYLSYDLATIKCDVKFDFDLEKARFNNFDKEEVVKLFSEFEFQSLLPRIQDLGRSESTSDKHTEINKFERNKKLFKYVLVDNESKFKIFFEKLKTQKEFTFDTETSSFDTLRADLLGISFSWKKGEAYYLQINNIKSKINTENNLFNYQEADNKKTGVKIINSWLEKLKPIFEDKKIKKYAHNLKFDIKVMKAQGINVRGNNFDTMIASYLLNPGSRQHNLDTVTFTELGFEKISKEDLLGKGKNKITFPEVEIENLSLYSCEDADFTNRLVTKLKKQIKDADLNDLFNKIEMPLVDVLVEMESNGIGLDTNFLAIFSKKVNKKIRTLEKKIWQAAEVEFNINSTKQLKEILFEKLEISTDGIKKGKTGYSTAFDELEKLKEHHVIIRFIQEYREFTKLASTYVDALPKLVNKRTKRVHSSFNQTVTATGRLSSTEPNLQNIPVKTELGRETRKAFVAAKGYKLLALDYSQIELRLAAHMSGDVKMIKAFQEGRDIHISTAAEINGVNLDDVTPEMRREAKATNFGILYGQGPHGLSQTADIPYARAKEFIQEYFITFPGVQKFIDSTIEQARELGYVATLFDRKRFLPEIISSMAMVRKSAERMAVNTPLQGTAADMIKIAMINVFKEIKDMPECKMLIQVHDELIFEIIEERAEVCAEKIKKIMENVIKLKVPIVVDVKIGNSWGEMKNLK